MNLLTKKLTQEMQDRFSTTIKAKTLMMQYLIDIAQRHCYKVRLTLPNSHTTSSYKYSEGQSWHLIEHPTKKKKYVQN